MLLSQENWIHTPSLSFDRSVIKGARLIQSEGQAKLYFAPSIENQTGWSGCLLQRGESSLPYRLAFKGKGHVVGPGHAQVANQFVTHRESCSHARSHTGGQLNYNLP